MIPRFPSIRILYLFFNYLARQIGPQLEPLQEDLRAARFSTTFHGYLARTMLYAVAGFVLVLAGSVVLALWLLGPAPFRSASPVLLGGLVLPAVAGSYGIYRVRLYWPSYRAEERARAIETSLPNVTNFLLALSRAGVSPAKTLELIAEHADILGEAGVEFEYAYRDMQYFGADVVSALNELGETTPSEQLKDLIDGYTRALTGRGDATDYLDQEMEALFEAAELDQDEFLSSLGVLAEVYVALFVAFPIFALITLVVMGFLGTEAVLTTIRVVVYLILPLTAIGFLVLLDVYMENPLAQASRYRELTIPSQYDLSLKNLPRIDRGRAEAEADQLEMLERYHLRQRIEEFLQAPLARLRERPRYAFYVGMVVAIGYAGTRIGVGVLDPTLPFAAPIPADGPVMDVVRAVDEPLIEGLIMLLGIYVVFYELRARYLKAIEAALPDFLGELADRHQIGMALSASLRQLGDKDMGALETEIERMRRDLRLNSPAGEVLERFANRVRSGIVTRVVVLLVAAEETADRLSPVIDALANRAALTRQLKVERRVEMSLYVIIIYLAFLIFLVILAILNNVFLPEVPSEGLSVGGIGGASGFDQVEYQTVFYHMSVLQGLLSGLVGGKMGEGSVSAGGKHALIMVILAYLLFSIVLPGVTIQL